MSPKPLCALIALLIVVATPTTMPAMVSAGTTTQGPEHALLIEGGCGLCYENYVLGDPYHSFAEFENGPQPSDVIALAGPSMFECNGVDGHTSCEDGAKYEFFCDVSHDPCGGESLLTVDVDQMEGATSAGALLSLVVAHEKNIRVNVKRSALEPVDCQGRLDGHIPISPDLLTQVVASLQELHVDQVVLGA